MKPIRFTQQMLTQAMQHMTVATLAQLCQALGGCAPSTLHRKLKLLDYLSSYSHAGKYYTLRETAEFDEYGLWAYDEILFSCHGTLRNTVLHLVSNSSMGYQPVELDELLQVKTLNVLSSLVRQGKLTRVRFAGRSIYCSACSINQKRQLKTRQLDQASIMLPHSSRKLSITSKVKALFLSALDEKQIRLLAGFLSIMWGYGGDTNVALFLGLSRTTVWKGRNQLYSGKVDLNRTRKQGGGRIPLKKKPLDDRSTAPTVRV